MIVPLPMKLCSEMANEALEGDGAAVVNEVARSSRTGTQTGGRFVSSDQPSEAP